MRGGPTTSVARSACMSGPKPSKRIGSHPPVASASQSACAATSSTHSIRSRTRRAQRSSACSRRGWALSPFAAACADYLERHRYGSATVTDFLDALDCSHWQARRPRVRDVPRPERRSRSFRCTRLHERARASFARAAPVRGPGIDCRRAALADPGVCALRKRKRESNRMHAAGRARGIAGPRSRLSGVRRRQCRRSWLLPASLQCRLAGASRPASRCADVRGVRERAL